MWPIFLSFGGEDVADYAFRTLEDRQKIEKLWEDGWTPKEISETTGVSVHVRRFSPECYRGLGQTDQHRAGHRFGGGHKRGGGPGRADRRGDHQIGGGGPYQL